MKNKKGFTLIEIIVCITLVVVIGVSTFIGFRVYKNSDKDKEKVITEITSAADVYYEANENIKEKLENNYGYLVVDIKELKDNGIIDENKKIPELTNEEENEGKTYEKLVIDGSDDEVGLIDIIYPYEENEKILMKNLEPLYIEAFEKEEFKCNTGLVHIDYLNKDYEVVKSENFLCGIDGLEEENAEDNTIYKDKDTTINLLDGENDVRYKISDDFTAIRKVSVNKEYNPSLKAITVEDQNDYDCKGSTYINQDVILTLNDNDEFAIRNNLTFEWKKDNITISDETQNNYTVIENGTYKVSYTLKGSISNDSSYTGEKECKVLIDKDKPDIEIEENNNKINVKITDTGGSGVYGYILNDEQLNENNLTKDDFTVGSSFSFNKPSRTTTYYIYAMDNAGNIKEEIYETIGDEDYPKITYEPIENSFTKFKVTVKDISGKNYDIDDIKVQFEFDKAKYNYYNSNYNPGRYDKYNLETFLRNYTYNKEYDIKKQNYINIEKECSNNECSFIIDMEQQIQKCGNEYYCKRIVSYKDLYNLSLNYYIKATNTKGYYKELKLNSVLNIYEDENTFDSNWFNYNKYYSYLAGTNLNGDILFYKSYKYFDDRELEIYYYDTKNNKTILIGRYYGYYVRNVFFNWFNNDSIGFTTCKTYVHNDRWWKKYERYKYNLKTGTLSLYKKNDSPDASDCNFSSTVRQDYVAETYYSKYKNGSYLREYLSRLYDWEKTTTTNPTSHNTNDTLNNYIFYSDKNDKTWESILTRDYYDAGGENRIDSNKLFYLPEVTLTKKDISVGTAS